MNQRIWETDEMDHANKMLKKFILYNSASWRCSRYKILSPRGLQSHSFDSRWFSSLQAKPFRSKWSKRSQANTIECTWSERGKIINHRLRLAADNWTPPKPAWVHFKKSVHSSRNHFKIRRESQSIDERWMLQIVRTCSNVHQGLWSPLSLHWLYSIYHQAYTLSTMNVIHHRTMFLLIIRWEACPHAGRIHLYKHIFRNFKID